MRLRLLTIITIIFGFAGSVQPVFADPITVRFNVTVTTRDSVQFGTPVESIDPFSFVLSATFDDQVTDYRPGRNYSFATFGPVTFSGVPELGGPAPGDVPFGFSTLEREDCCGENASLHAGVRSNFDPSTGFLERFKGVLLSNGGYPSPIFLPREEATTARLLSILSSGRISVFNVASTRSGTGLVIYEPGSYRYSGTFTQLDSAPVPEPASMLLVATGLLGAGVRRWRQRNTSRAAS